MLLDLLPGGAAAPRHPVEGGPPGVEPEKSEIPDVFVSCDAREVEAAHPILNGDTGLIFGSNLLVTYGKPARTLFGVVLKPGGARAFYDRERCSSG